MTAKQQPSKEQWAQVERGLHGVFGNATLRVDGYTVDLRKSQASESRLAIVCYVDGWLRGEWLTEDCEERRRFMRPVKKYLWSRRQRADLKRKSKSMLAELNIDPDKYITQYRMGWPSFAPLRRHLCRNNDCIEVLDVNGDELDLGDAEAS